ncbi:hypothetical protein AKJ64_03780 [candidate division MSBL1 archaeon SCGC-AAA259E17]|uniref:site-specific DNA-methyltransferase (adenine-specific) n=1 Tax=candidate division MSBL1 archaeon SCGC-AAA259E17 TaxID=1698263 RepID=A0A133UDD2_9EURY|nr:hypothetical protein AKJ64_03780 [candidate division MSBL1 archaeon SCGC-AAA259E17]
MKGQILTPPHIVDAMVEKLFQERNPNSEDYVLDPGCGSGAFIKGILRWCDKKKIDPPRIVGIETDDELIKKAQNSVGDRENVTLLEKDFLLSELGFYDFIIGNPPYVPIEELEEEEKEKYKKIFYESAFNRFDLYILFFEKALKQLKPEGRLVFITPEKFEYTLTAEPLRRFLASHHVEEIHHLEEDAFEGLVTYPTITTVVSEKNRDTTIRLRNGETFTVKLPSDGSRWISTIRGDEELGESDRTLDDICVRISCGVATGRDGIFVKPKEKVPSPLKKYTKPTLSGKELTKNGVNPNNEIIIPYDDQGNLLPKEELAEFIDWISSYKEELKSRHCVAEGGKKWYAFHETPPLGDILNPKVLCKDVTKEPKFWVDKEGDIVPRHSVYYIVLKNSVSITDLLDYLNGERAGKWLISHCQRAANDFIRLQSSTLKQLPIPKKL